MNFKFPNNKSVYKTTNDVVITQSCLWHAHQNGWLFSDYDLFQLDWNARRMDSNNVFTKTFPAERVFILKSENQKIKDFIKANHYFHNDKAKLALYFKLVEDAMPSMKSKIDLTIPKGTEFKVSSVDFKANARPNGYKNNITLLDLKSKKRFLIFLDDLERIDAEEIEVEEKVKIKTNKKSNLTI